MLVQQKRFADVFDFRNGALEVEGFGKDDFENLRGERITISGWADKKRVDTSHL